MVRPVLHAIAVDDEGRTVVAAAEVVAGNLRPFVVRLLATGELDTSFSGDGVIALEPPLSVFESA
jgi:hypothetical protein